MISRRSFLAGTAGAAIAAGVAAPRAASAVTSTSAAGPNWQTLQQQLQGTLVLPSDSSYPVAKQLFWGQYDSINPAAIAYCTNASDASACIRFARANGVQATPRSGGHCFAGYSTGTGLVVDMSQVNGVQVGDSTVTIGGGAAMVDVVAALAPYGLAVPGGSEATVCMGGFVQGGGSGWLTRTAGMASDSLVSAQVVLADGSTVTCSADQEPELFWALRGGGGGNFGVVTSYEMVPTQLATMTSFVLTWPWDSAADLWTGWQQWALSLPWDITSALNFLLEDAAPGNVPSVTAFGISLGDTSDLNTQLAALAASVGSQPSSSTITTSTYQQSMMTWYRCGTLTVPECHRVGTSSVAELPREPYSLNRNRLAASAIPASGINSMLTAFNASRTSGHLRVLSCTVLGGQANVIPRDATAFVHREAMFLLDYGTELFTSTPSTADATAARDWIDGGFAAMDPVSNGESYQNFIDPALTDWRQSYYAEAYPALVAIKNTYDPDNYFHFAQSIGA